MAEDATFLDTMRRSIPFYRQEVLWDNGIKHEYRHVLGVDHVGDSLDGRFRYALAFIGGQWSPPREDGGVREFRRMIELARRAACLDARWWPG